MITERDLSIDILKFLAVLLIINSHMDICYPKYSILATGGAIGDVFFLFASGYTLLLSKRKLRFDNWYKRRINRIYPSVLVCALMGACFTRSNKVSLGALFGGEFIIAIMIYYIGVFWIKQFLVRYIPYIIIGIGIISFIIYLVWFPCKNETGDHGIYGITTYYRWIPYFAFMLFGSYCGIRRTKLVVKPFRDFFLMLVCLILFYGIQLLSKRYIEVAPFQFFTLLPLMGIVYYFYKFCHANFLKKIYSNRIGNLIIMTISGLCLESYLIQFYLFTSKLNGIFPLNLPIIVLIVLFVSFFCKCLSRLFIQTFKDGEYNWKNVIKLY